MEPAWYGRIPSEADKQGGPHMGFVKTLVKGAVVAKLMQVAQRELSKPENQQKIRETFQKVQQKAASRTSR